MYIKKQQQKMKVRADVYKGTNKLREGMMYIKEQQQQKKDKKVRDDVFK